jgi:hypothetical protein
MKFFLNLILFYAFILSPSPLFYANASEILHSTDSSNLKHIKSDIRKEIRPYLIPTNHPMKGNLDAIFHATRATQSQEAFTAAGFDIFSVRPRSHVIVARHPNLPGYVLKANMDNNTKLKRKKTSWKWFQLRCIGAEKVHRIIKEKNIKNFVVADKWIYALPKNPSPPIDIHYTRHPVILLATDMNLVSKKENLQAWKTKITKTHLNELYDIISHARGSSYRPDNITYTKNNTFAFIDTEYPDSKPDYTSIRPYLNPQMRDYWDHLVKKGGW